MRRFSVCVTLLLLASATTARMRTDVVFDAEVDFSAFESYGWKVGHDKDSGHALSEGQPLEIELRALADGELQRRGMNLKSEGTPDIWIVFLGYATERMWVDGVKHQLTDHIQFASQGAVLSEMEGTLILEVFESEGEELLWSAASRDVAGSRQALLGKGAKALKKILKLLPVGR